VATVLALPASDSTSAITRLSYANAASRSVRRAERNCHGRQSCPSRESYDRMMSDSVMPGPLMVARGPTMPSRMFLFALA